MERGVDEQWEVEWIMLLSKESEATADIVLLCGKAKSI